MTVMTVKFPIMAVTAAIALFSIAKPTISFQHDALPTRIRPSTRLRSTDYAKWRENVGTSAVNAVSKLATSASPTDASLRLQQQQQEEGGDKYKPAELFRSSLESTSEGSLGGSSDQRIVVEALVNLERDMQLLDNLAAERPQLSPLEFTLLGLSVTSALASPIIFRDLYKVTEVVAPAAAAFAASIGIGAEFIGKVAVADGKEVAAQTLLCAAEAEALLANAERIKAVMPLCVGISATAATFAILAPVIIESLSITNIQVVTELFLLCPLIAILSAAVSCLALQETRSFSARAISTGNRRFAKSGLVGRTWLSTTQQIQQKSLSTNNRWKAFAISVVPSPLLGVICPGTLSTKTILVAALAACQTAYFLMLAESTLARGTDAVALKSRSAAVSDTYANQGARSAAILPFTSALSSLCAAATAAIVELPWVEAANTGNAGTLLLQTVGIAFFPIMSSLFASAASVSKAKCQVDAEAATQAAATLAVEYGEGGDGKDDPVLRPFRGVLELIRSTATSLRNSMKRGTYWTWFFKDFWGGLAWWKSDAGKDDTDNAQLASA